MALSRMCSINSCQQISRALCDCCKQLVCEDHLVEHSDLLNHQLTRLTDEINTLRDEFNEVSRHRSTFQELEVWRTNAHRAIDHFCEKKEQEFKDFFYRERREQTIKFDQFEDKLNEQFQKQEATRENINSISSSIRYFQRIINQFHRPLFTLHPLVVDDSLIHIQQRKISPFPFLSTRIEHDQLLLSLAANDDHLLLAQNSHLLLLDREMKVKRKNPWDYECIRDMFWSETLTQFILITAGELYAVDKTITTIRRLPVDCNKNTSDWYRGTCSNDYLFLSTSFAGSCIYKYALQPSIELIEKFRLPFSYTDDEVIRSLSSSNSALACVIVSGQTEVRLNLRSLKTLALYWSCHLGSMHHADRVRCCWLRGDTWLVIDPSNSEVLCISADGKLVKEYDYNPKPYHAVQYGDNVLVISTEKHLNVHSLP